MNGIDIILLQVVCICNHDQKVFNQCSLTLEYKRYCTFVQEEGLLGKVGVEGGTGGVQVNYI